MIYHKDLAGGRWKELSLTEQMANIGSEVHRALNWARKKEQEHSQLAFERGLELFDLTISDSRWRKRLKEICRAREVFCGLVTEPEKFRELDKELDSFNNYFFQFGVCARAGRS
jgi:hypothetical protein